MKSATLFIYLTIILGLNSLAAQAGPAQTNSTFADMQSGSLLGMANLSIGQQFFDNHNFSIGAGYVPKSDSHEELTLFSLRYRYQHPAHWNIGHQHSQFKFSPFNLGITTLIGNHQDLFVELPQHYPDDYYLPTAFRLLMNYQSSLHLPNNYEAYFDISVLDVGLVSYLRDPDFYAEHYDFGGLAGISSWGFGLRKHF